MSLPLLEPSAYDTEDDGRDETDSVSFNPDASDEKDHPSAVPSQGRISQLRLERQRVVEAQRRLDEEEEELELQELRAANRARELSIQQRRRLLNQAAAAPPLPPVMEVAAPAAAAVVYTPVRPSSASSAASRRLQMSATTVSQGALAATLARQQSIEELPDDPEAVVIQRPAATPAALRGTATVPAAATPSEVAKVKTPLPAPFTSVDQQQNRDVKAWIAQLDNYLSAFGLSPADYLSKATAYLTGKAFNWLSNKKAEVAAAGKVVTWEWLCTQLILDFAQASGGAALHAEWKALTMGSHGRGDPSKATRTVRQYTSLFVELMTALTPHQITTNELTIIDKYVEGIERGYPRLYAVMKGAELQLQYKSLLEARDAAALAESQIAAADVSSDRRDRHSSSRPTHINNTYTVLDDGEAETEDDSPDQVEGKPKTASSINRLDGSSSSGGRQGKMPNDGRHILTAAEKDMLYKDKRCYRCYGQHPFGRHVPRCDKPVQKAAPRPLNP